jgi:hypothetical protein
LNGPLVLATRVEVQDCHGLTPLPGRVLSINALSGYHPNTGSARCSICVARRHRSTPLPSTMQEPGVSRLVSVKMNAAEAAA